MKLSCSHSWSDDLSADSSAYTLLYIHSADVVQSALLELLSPIAAPHLKPINATTVQTYCNYCAINLRSCCLWNGCFEDGALSQSVALFKVTLRGSRNFSMMSLHHLNRSSWQLHATCLWSVAVCTLSINSCWVLTVRVQVEPWTSETEIPP